MNIALTSDFPSTAIAAVAELMRHRNPDPRIAWVPPSSKPGGEYYELAQERFSEYGFSKLEYCDIDEQPDENQWRSLDRYDVIYLTGGDPLICRQNMIRNRISSRLREFARAGGLIVGASGGSMQLTRNILLYRPATRPLDQVLAEHGEYDGLGLVAYEILPHLNRHASSFLEKVRLYSVRNDYDVIGLADGAALLHVNSHDYVSAGKITIFHKGKVIPTDTY